MTEPIQATIAAYQAFDLVPVVVLLTAAVMAVPLFRCIGHGSVLGYLPTELAIWPKHIQRPHQNHFGQNHRRTGCGRIAATMPIGSGMR